MRLLLAAGLLAVATGAAAQFLEPRDRGQWRDAQKSNALFDRLDRNKDGALSAEELASDTANAGNWITIDRNGDGRIGRDEFTIVDPSRVVAK
jgi:hypothetical protein